MQFNSVARMETLKAEFKRTVPTSPKQWRKLMGKVADDVRRIGERGGRAVFLQLPTRGRYSEIENSFHPPSNPGMTSWSTSAP